MIHVVQNQMKCALLNERLRDIPLVIKSLVLKNSLQDITWGSSEAILITKQELLEDLNQFICCHFELPRRWLFFTKWFRLHLTDEKIRLLCQAIFVMCTMYQDKVDVDMLNAVKSALAEVSSVSPSSEQRGDHELGESL